MLYHPNETINRICTEEHKKFKAMKKEVKKLKGADYGRQL